MRPPPASALHNSQQPLIGANSCRAMIHFSQIPSTTTSESSPPPSLHLLRVPPPSQSGRNAYSRGIEHLEYLEANDEDKSVLWLHSIHHHQRRPDVKYSMKVTGTFQDPLDRQIMEKIQIQNFKGPVLMNRRSEMGGVRVERMQYRRWGGGN